MSNYRHASADGSRFRVRLRLYTGWHEGRTRTLRFQGIDKIKGTYASRVRTYHDGRVAFLGGDDGHIDIECGDESTELTFDSVCETLEQPEDRLRVFVVNGVAGVGKSHLIERIVRRRAAPASYKSGTPLLLHVESRGKVLTSLSDRIAGTLSSLRASFVEEELKPLIRRGAVQVAIDGFDELSDSRGYVRAWGALRDFVRDLRGQGTCVLAGRDTMLDVGAVRDGLGNTINEDSVTFLRIQHLLRGMSVPGCPAARDGPVGDKN